MLVFKRLLYMQTTRKLSKTIQLTNKKDPGIRRQAKLLKTNPEDDIEDIEFEDFETDFMDVHKTHKEHTEELRVMKEHEKYLIVKQKYFKEKYPNFLTWHDKEQIRYLHSQDPQEWSIERLSESFPALPEVIRKITRMKWTKRTEVKITNHDQAAKTNWEEFKKGRLDYLPKDLKQHLQKFTSRSLNVNNFVVPGSSDVNTVIKTKSNVFKGEFSEIISSYEQLKSKNNSNCTPENETKKSDFKEISFDPSKQSKNKTLFTLPELENKIKERSIQGGKVTDEDKHMLQTLGTFSETENNVIELNNQQNFNEIMEKKYESSTKLGVVRKSSKDVSHLVYPERITIPKTLYKKHLVYKLNDCFYDSDGEFLYRVPGMG